MKNTKKSLLISILSLILCVSMLLGTTYAWFTDSVASGVNRIVAGNLDVDMLYKSGIMTEYKTVNGVATTENGSTPFFVDKDGGKILWEPGVMVYTYFDVKNLGTLALRYNFALRITGKNALETNGVKHSLDEVIKAVVLPGEVAGDQVKSSVEGKEWKSIESFTDADSLLPNGNKKFTVVLYWAPTANDDLYNVKNGQHTTKAGAWENQDEKALYIDFDIRLTATQLEHESDSFDNQYDKFADLWKLSTVTPDGRWVGITKGEGCILDGTLDPYITVVGADGQPGEIIALTDELDQSVGSGNIKVSGNNVTYTNSGAAQEVVIRTNGGILAVDDASNGTIFHYGQAGYLNVIQCGMSSYHEFGYVPAAEISKGRIVNENASFEVTNKDGEKEIVEAGVKVLYVNSIENEDITADTVFDDITVAAANGAELPEFRRGVVNIADEGTLVIKTQVVEGDSTKEESVKTEDDVWLYKQGTIAQMVVVSSDKGVEGIKKDEESGNFVASNDTQIVLVLGVKDETPANQKASVELANVYTGDKVDYTVNNTNAPKLDADGNVLIEEGRTAAEIAAEHSKPEAEVIAEALEEVVTDKGTAAEKEKEEIQKAVEGYVAYNSTTMKYYKDAEEAFNEAEPVSDTVVLLADVEVLLDNIQNEVNVDLNGHEIKRNYISSKYIQIGQLGLGSSLNYYIYTYDPFDSTYFYSTDTNWYKVNGSTYALWYLFSNSTGWDKVSDKDLYDIVDYYWPQYAKCEISNLDTIDTFVGNTTALKYFAGGFGTEEKPFEISTSQHFGNINFLGLERRVYYKLMNDLTAEGYAEDYDYDFDLNGKTLKPLRNAAFWANNYLKVHNGNVVLTADNGSLFGDDSSTSNVYVENINLSGNVKAAGYHYGALCKYLGNTANNNSQTSTCYVKNLNSNVNIKAEGASVGGLFGYCLNSAISLENVNVYSSIETGNTAGGIVMGDSQVCGYSNVEAHQYIKVENVKFYGSILVPEGKSAYIYGQTKPKNTTDADFQGEGATIVKGINIDKDIIIAENNEFKINAKSAYTKYVVKLTFSIDYADGKAGGYPRTIEREFVITSDELISTGLYKNAILTTDNIEGMTLISDDYNSIYVKDGVDDDIYYFLTYGTYKLSNNNVTVKVYAYTGENLKAIGTYSYTYNLGE